MNLYDRVTKADKAYTHGGVFHADDVFATALLKIINPDIKIERVFNVDGLSEDAIIFDIGNGEYDHHLPDKVKRENGIPYAAFGLLWRDLGDTLVGYQHAMQIDKCIVQDIDYTDNEGMKVNPNPLTTAIAQFNPTWEEQEHNITTDMKFIEAVEVATAILKRKIVRLESETAARDRVITAALYAKTTEMPNIMVLTSYVPWKNAVVNSDLCDHIKLVTYPSSRGGWNLEQIPVDKQSSDKYRAPFPKDANGDYIVPDKCTFIHTKGFLASFDTLEDVLACAGVVLIPVLHTEKLRAELIDTAV